MLPLLILAAFLRTQEISTVGLQCDESFVQRMVEFPWGEMFDRIGRDTHPPLFFVIDKLWVQIFGDGVVAGRALSALLGIGGVAGLYAFVREACRRDDQRSGSRFLEADLPGLVAALILAVTPLQIFWSLQIRMYSLAVALTAWSSYLLIRAWKRGGAVNWSVYTLSAILLSYSHYFGLFILASQFLCSAGLLLSRKDGDWFERVRPVALSACGVWVAWQPWLPYFLQQRDQVEQSFYLPKPSWTVFGSMLHEVWIDFGLPPSSVVGLIFAQLLVVVLLVLLLQRRPADFLIAVSAALPLGAAFALSSVSRSILHGRYFLLTQVFWIAAVAVVACRLWSPWRYIALGTLAWGMWWTCRDHYVRRGDQARLPGMTSAVARIDASRGQDPLVVCNPMLFTSAVSYSANRENLYLFRPPHGFPFFMCTAVIRDEQYIDRDALNRLNSRYLWTMDADESMGRVPVPDGWKLLREERIAEWYVTLIVRLYARE